MSDTTPHPEGCCCASCETVVHSHSHNNSHTHSHDHSHVTLAFTSGNASTDAVLDNFSWTGTTGQGATISYDFASNFSGSDQAATRQALSAWASVANVNFVEQGSGGDITFTRTNFSDPFVGGEAAISFTGTTILDVEVRISNNQSNLAFGTQGYYILLHEIGHALGLKHPGDYGAGDPGPFLPPTEDTTNASVLSYNQGFGGLFPATPMLYDVSAIQFLYGANTGTNAGDTTYIFNGTDSYTSTIYDAGGTDMLSAASLNTSARIDLQSGVARFSQVGSERAFVAPGTVIENAEGSSGNDQIFGNASNNTLFGRAGIDLLEGNNGQDTIFGGVGIVDTTDAGDSIFGGHGNDALYGNAGNDTIHGGIAVADPNDGSDLAYGGKGFDLVYGNAGNDTLFGGGSGVDPFDEADTVYGGKGADEIYGNGSDDFLFGGGSNVDPGDQGDLIYGGAGNDSILGNGGADSIYGQAGNDTMHAGVGDDLYVFDIFSDGADTILLFEGAGASGGDMLMFASNINNTGIGSAADVLSRISYNTGNAVVDLGGGFTITIENLGGATLAESDIGIF